MTIEKSTKTSVATIKLSEKQKREISKVKFTLYIRSINFPKGIRLKIDENENTIKETTSSDR